MPADVTSVQSSRTILPGTVWKLGSYFNGDQLVQPLPDAVITLNLQDDGQITGLSGINRYFGQYSINGVSLTMTGIGSTLMAGPEPLMDQESSYLQLLSAVTSYQLSGTSLDFYDKTGRIVLTFTLTDNFQKTTVIDPEKVLPGTNWKLVSYMKEGMAVSGNDVSKISLKFDNAGNISGFAGVNSYFASYTINRNVIIIGPVGSTKMAGTEPMMAMEDTYLGLLQSVKGVTVGTKTLELTDSAGNILLVFTQQGLSSLFESPVSNPVVIQTTSSSKEVLTSLMSQKPPKFVPIEPPHVVPQSSLPPPSTLRYSDAIVPPKHLPKGLFY